MKRFGKGPEIKLPPVKVPGFVADIYDDLRDRHLLPIVGLLLVAIVAVPILLSESSGSVEVAVTPSVASTSSNASSARKIVVSRSTPKLRSYHKRLAHRTPSNPFKPVYTSAKPAESSESESGSGSGSSAGGTSSGSGAGEGTATHQETTITEHHEIKYFTYTIDVNIVPVSVKGVPSTAKPTTRRHVPELTSLPTRQVPALTFLEPAADGKKAVMLVNDGVEAILGDNPCISGTEKCQLLALEPGVPETIVYGSSERTYRIKLLKVNLDQTKKLVKAPLHKK